MNKSKIIRIISSGIAIVFFFSIATASGCDPFNERRIPDEAELSEQAKATNNEIEEIMRNEGIDRDEAEKKYREGYDRIFEIMEDEEISYDEAKDKYFEEVRVREEKEWEDCEERLYKKFLSEGMDDEEARREAAVITYMDRYDVTEEEAKKALGFEGTETTETTTEGTTTEETTTEETTTEETTTEATTETTADQKDAIDAWLAFLDDNWEGEVPYYSDGKITTYYETNNYKETIEYYMNNGTAVSIEDGTGALILGSSEYRVFTVYKIDENTIKICYPDIYVPNEYTYTRSA